MAGPEGVPGRFSAFGGGINPTEKKSLSPADIAVSKADGKVGKVKARLPGRDDY